METLFQAGQKREETSGPLHDEFLELAVHDLDAPLRKLVLLTERLEEKCIAISLPDDLQPYLSRISSCANDMRSLIDDLHSLTSINSQQTNFSTCSLDEIVQNAMQALLVPLNETKARVEVAPLPVIRGDKNLLTILFKNLLLNALKFAKKDTIPDIRVSTSALDEAENDALQLPGGKSYHRIEFADNGIGLKREDQHKIFMPFVTLHGKATFRGNGMGLAICQKIANLHDGWLYAVGDDQNGAVFHFIVPQTL